MRRGARSGEPQPTLMRVLSRGVAVALVLGLGTLPSSSADESPGYPPHPLFPGQGLPDVEQVAPGGGYIPPQAAAITKVERARQWLRTPSLQLAAYSRTALYLEDRTCQRLEPAGVRRRNTFHADAVLVNQAAAPRARDRFGRTEPFEVRTVAFGSIPVTASVAIEQPRSAKGTVVPSVLTQVHAFWCDGRGDFGSPPPGLDPAIGNSLYLPVTLNAEVSVRVEAMAVDGVDLALADGCRSDAAQLRLTSTEWQPWDPALDWATVPWAAAGELPSAELLSRTGLFSIGYGGLLHGTLHVPAFSGCVTKGGDDVSPLLTATVSGPGNRVEMRTQGLNGDGTRTSYDQCPLDGTNCEPFFPPLPLPEKESDPDDRTRGDRVVGR